VKRFSDKMKAHAGEATEGNREAAENRIAERRFL
jgi:hypothetical protein